MLLEERLKELRKENGFKQEDIAFRLGISTSAYGYYEQGKTIPNAIAIEELADLYNVSTDYLLGRSIIRNPSAMNKTIAAHQEGELSEKEVQELNDFVDYLYSKRDKEKQ